MASSTVIAFVAVPCICSIAYTATDVVRDMLSDDWTTVDSGMLHDVEKNAQFAFTSKDTEIGKKDFVAIDVSELERWKYAEKWSRNGIAPARVFDAYGCDLGAH